MGKQKQKMEKKTGKTEKKREDEVQNENGEDIQTVSA